MSAVSGAEKSIPAAASLNASRGVTMLLTSHYMRDVEALCNRVLVIAHGRIIYDGPLAGIMPSGRNWPLS